jgi:hypothetical protein
MPLEPADVRIEARDVPLHTRRQAYRLFEGDRLRALTANKKVMIEAEQRAKQ